MWNLNYWFGNGEWGECTRLRVKVAAFYFVFSVVAIMIYLLKPCGFNTATGKAQFCWCVVCGLMGLSFRAWQYRKDAVQKKEDDLRADAKLVPPPFPAYIVDYPIIVLVNSIAVYILARYLQSEMNVNFYYVAFPMGFYFGSIMKLVNPKL